METNRHARGWILPALASAALILNGCTSRVAPEQVGPSQTVVASHPRAASKPTTVHVSGDEFKVSGPYAHANLEVFLIHSDKQRASKRKILTLEEALEKKLVKVHETGEVQELAIENLSPDADIFVQAGEIVQGGKQDRVLSMDLLVKPNSGKVALASFCVEQGRWSPRGRLQNVLADGLRGSLMAELDGERTFASSSNAISSKELKKAVKLSQAQQEVWSEVARIQSNLVRNSSASAVSGQFASSLELTLGSATVQKSIEEYKKAYASILRDGDKVVGFAFAINGELNSAEIYANSDLFRALWKKNLQACAVEAVSVADESKPDTRPTPKSEVAAFLTVPENTAGESRPINTRMQLVTVDSETRAFHETRDKQANAAWIHRSYLKK